MILKYFELICKFSNYYHEEGDSFESFDDNISPNYFFYILVYGRTSTGKSSFMNQFLGERKAKEGVNLSVSYKIVIYGCQNNSINIRDTSGFEYEKIFFHMMKEAF